MFKIDGFDDMIRRLNNLDQELEAPVQKGVYKAAQRVQRDAKLLCGGFKESTGRLKGSIQAAVATNMASKQTEGIVSTNVEYAAYVEYGTGQRGAGSNIERPESGIAYKSDWAGMAAKPYLYPALKQNEGKIANDIASELKKWLGD
jgi:HK97 gp10 family phage protein